MAYIGKSPTVGNFQVCDAISVVNGQAAYTLQVGGANVAPESANHMLVSLNGILQKPGSSFTVSGSTMTFASNLATGDVIDFVQILGNVLDLGTPSDDTVTAAKLNNDIISGQTALTAEPDDTDEFLVSDAGTIKRIDYSLIKGDGKILQVVTATDSTERSTTSSSFVTASNTLSVDITPSSSSNKIYVICNFNSKNSTGSLTSYTLYRDSSNLGATDGMVQTTHATANQLTVTASMSILDSPSTTSQITYQPYVKCSSGTAYFNANDLKGTITAFEVSA